MGRIDEWKDGIKDEGLKTLRKGVVTVGNVDMYGWSDKWMDTCRKITKEEIRGRKNGKIEKVKKEMVGEG